jgi:hypothetical protein
MYAARRTLGGNAAAAAVTCYGATSSRSVLLMLERRAATTGRFAVPLSSRAAYSSRPGLGSPLPHPLHLNLFYK